MKKKKRITKQKYSASRMLLPREKALEITEKNQTS